MCVRNQKPVDWAALVYGFCWGYKSGWQLRQSSSGGILRLKGVFQDGSLSWPFTIGIFSWSFGSLFGWWQLSHPRTQDPGEWPEQKPWTFLWFNLQSQAQITKSHSYSRERGRLCPWGNIKYLWPYLGVVVGRSSGLICFCIFVLARHDLPLSYTPSPEEYYFICDLETFYCPKGNHWDYIDKIKYQQTITTV